MDERHVITHARLQCAGAAAVVMNRILRMGLLIRSPNSCWPKNNHQTECDRKSKAREVHHQRSSIMGPPDQARACCVPRPPKKAEGRIFIRPSNTFYNENTAKSGFGFLMRRRRLAPAQP